MRLGSVRLQPHTARSAQRGKESANITGCVRIKNGGVGERLKPAVLKTHLPPSSELFSVGYDPHHRPVSGYSGTFGIGYATECATHPKLPARSH